MAKRLNMEIAGFRTLVQKTARKLPLDETPASYREALTGIDERWGDPLYWRAIARNRHGVTPFYLLASLDLAENEEGHLGRAEPEKAIYLDIFSRTFGMSAVVTLFSLLLGFPLAYWLAILP